jgi:hypothetical protein
MILPFVFLLNAKDHDFKMSVCEIVYSTDNEAFDVKFYLFQDDLKAALYNNPDAPTIEGNKASEYILRHFNLNINGQAQSLVFQSLKEKNDQVLAQFSTQKIPLASLSKMQVKNNLLLEKFREQINMVYALLPGRDKLVQMLNATKTEAGFSF